MFGAALPVVTILTSPITQQAIQYPIRSVVFSDGISSVSAIRNFRTFEDSKSLNPGTFQRTIGQGLVGMQPVLSELVPVPLTPPTCTAPECHYDRFSSLSVCARSHNITHLLHVEKMTNVSDADWTAAENTSNQTLIAPHALNITLNPNCTLVTPYPIFVQTCTGSSSNVDTGDSDLDLATFLTLSIIYGYIDGLQWNASTAVFDAANWSAPTVYLQAVEVSLFTCVREYEASFANNTGTVRPVSMSYAPNLNLTTKLRWNCPAPTYQNYTRKCDFPYDDPDYEDLAVTMPATVLKDPTHPEMQSTNPLDYYSVDQLSLGSLSYYLAKMFHQVYTYWNHARAQTEDKDTGMEIWSLPVRFLLMGNTSDHEEHMRQTQLLGDNLANAITNG